MVGFFIIAPAALVLKLALLPFEKPVERSPQEVATYLRDFLEGKGGYGDWDYFTSTEIADPRLNDIRERAANLNLPFGEEEEALLEELITEVMEIVAEEAAF
ncbi:hypothetical protein ACFSUK_26270 [Sphingobium scionense]|uniref:Uncharacterized protein n=1 Tax=Sphingobium scionense TaxID=1404341 RepID=A0A7W6PT88_9SPHN|nr:hypothetical protein [Sphingobium scionense]MBB4146308.1 hypothetical protein [Sphingobium scionense]